MAESCTRMAQTTALGRARSADTHRIPHTMEKYQYEVNSTLTEEIRRFTEEKRRVTMRDDEERWRDSIKKEMEEELDRRVREALETPTAQKSRPSGLLSDPTDPPNPRDMDSLEQLNAHIDLSMRDREIINQKRWKLLQTKRKLHRMMTQGDFAKYHRHGQGDEKDFPEDLDLMRQIEYEELVGSYSENNGTQTEHRTRSHDFYARLSNKAANDFANLSNTEKIELFYMFTKNGFRDVIRNGKALDGAEIEMLENGKFQDKFGVIRDQHGPFWPADYGPMYPAPKHRTEVESVKAKCEPMVDADIEEKQSSLDTNPANAKFPGKWRGVIITFDSEKSCRDYVPRPVSEGICPSLVFESRFECGNLRQARRIGAFEYELVLKTDLYTTRHTQWYYFRIQNITAGVSYKFKIINLHKRDSLYNHGMRPLVYSEAAAQSKSTGWVRTGHDIVYTRNTSNLQCPLLMRDRNYYTLEWQMEFARSDDTYYLAHCYPYTFSDLRDDLDNLLDDPQRSKVMKRQVMCETRAGNSCFLVTVTNFDCVDHSKKKAIIVTGRVHPGETNSSWMMRGLLQYITGSSPTAKTLRNKFIFKIVPMLNPDGVIVGNYRCSLAARDLNRNYRHPRKESFPTVWHTKALMAEVSNWNDILVYCDLHGHSRKHNVFMYGCNHECVSPPGQQGATPDIDPEMYLHERLFPWLMSQKAPDKFWFRGCKFQVRKSKEATGRVVMYKQMKIANSFTMEATFCGTTISSGERRHFNTQDYQEMGRVFCDVVLEYHDVNDNKARQSEVILELTRAITQQILETRGLLPNSFPDFTTERGREQLKEYSSDQLPSSQQVASAFIAMVTKDKSSHVKRPIKDQHSGDSNKDLSKMDVHELLDTMSSQTIDGCAQILEQLHIADSIGETDSSDSDSESEPEMKYSDPKARRRKKKAKKKAHSAIMEGSPCSPVDKNKGLPAIDRPDTEAQKRKKQNSGGKNGKGAAKSYPSYVNKYAGRSNHGIPCFSEERLLERASKRLLDVRMRDADDRRRSSVISTGDEDSSIHSSGGDAPNSGPPLHRRRSHTELRRQFHQLLQQTPSGGPHKIRVGYMHASEGIRGQSGPEDSSSEDSGEEETAHRLPLAAMRTPYQNVLNSLPGQPGFQHLQRRSARLPSWLPSLNHSCSIPLRHSITANHMSAHPHLSQGPLGNDLLTSSQPFARNLPGRKQVKKPEIQSHDPDGNQQGAPALMSREYTDLLLQRLRNNKSSSFGPSTISLRAGERHSTCE